MCVYQCVIYKPQQRDGRGPSRTVAPRRVRIQRMADITFICESLKTFTEITHKLTTSLSLRTNVDPLVNEKNQLDATILSILFHLILLSTCFGCYTHPSSGASNMYNQVWYNLITVIAMGVYFELDKYIKYHWLNI